MISMGPNVWDAQIFVSTEAVRSIGVLVVSSLVTSWYVLTTQPQAHSSLFSVLHTNDVNFHHLRRFIIHYHPNGRERTGLTYQNNGRPIYTQSTHLYRFVLVCAGFVIDLV